MRTMLTICGVLVFGARIFAVDARPARDPFWPVGYKPAEPAAIVAVVTPIASNNAVAPIAAEPTKPDPLLMERVAAELQAKIRQQCNVSGFMKSGSQNMAIVNGQIKRVGDTLGFLIEGRAYNFKVTAISPKSVKIEPVN